MRAIGKGSISSFLTALVNIGWYGVALGLVLMACLGVFALFGDLSNATMDIPVSFGLETQTLRVTAPSLGIENATLEKAYGTGKLKFPPPSRIFLASTAASVCLVLAIVLWMLSQLRAVFRTLRDGHPFVTANAMRIRRIAYIVILGELARYAFAFAGNYFTMTHFSADGLRFDVLPDLNVFAIIAGLIILVIAEVFGVGTRLDEDQSLTV